MLLQAFALYNARFPGEKARISTGFGPGNAQQANRLLLCPSTPTSVLPAALRKM